MTIEFVQIIEQIFPIIFAVCCTTNEFQLYKIWITKSLFELLGVCANFRKATIFFRHVFHLSVRVKQLSYLWDYVYKQLWDYVYKIWFLVFFKELARKFKFFKIGQLKCT